MVLVGEAVDVNVVSVPFETGVILIPIFVPDRNDSGNDARLIKEILHGPLEALLVFKDPEVVLNDYVRLFIIVIADLLRLLERYDHAHDAHHKDRHEKDHENEKACDYA